MFTLELSQAVSTDEPGNINLLWLVVVKLGDKNVFFLWFFMKILFPPNLTQPVGPICSLGDRKIQCGQAWDSLAGSSSLEDGGN